MAASKVFICYRRDDTAAYAGRLHGDLSRHFANNAVFMDLGIEPGDDFVEQVTVAIGSCAALLVVIGPAWLNRRLKDPEDLVRLEIAMALQRGVVVIPLLMRDASMPREHELPTSLAALARRNALRIRDDSWDDDVRRLVKRLRSVVATSSPRRVWFRRARDWLASSPPWPIVIGLVLLAMAAYILPGLLDGNDHPAREVKVGAIYALDGPDANANEEVLRGVRFAVDYLNGGDDGVDGADDGESMLPLKAGAGLPRLGGAQLKLVVSKRVTRCTVGPVFEGLVGRDVAAVIGAYESTITLRGIIAADTFHVPFVNAGSTVPALTRKAPRPRTKTCGDESELDPRPSHWFFRVGPDDVQAARQFFDFLDDEGIRARRVAMLGESRDIFGNGAAAATREVAEPRGVAVKRFKYDSVLGADVDPTNAVCEPREGIVRQLKAYHPDVAFAVGYPPDAITTVQTMQKLGYVPPAMLAYGSGYLDDTFIKGARRGNAACGLPPADPDGLISHTQWSPGTKDRSKTEQRIMELFERRYHRPMTSRSAVGFTGMMALAQGINDAGSVDHKAIRAALDALDVPSNATIMPWSGIRFDDNGQNTRAQVVLQQIIKGSTPSSIRETPPPPTRSSPSRKRASGRVRKFCGLCKGAWPGAANLEMCPGPVGIRSSCRRTSVSSFSGARRR